MTLSSAGTSVTDKMTLSFDKQEPQLFLSVVEKAARKPGLSPVSNKQLMLLRERQVSSRGFLTVFCNGAFFSQFY